MIIYIKHIYFNNFNIILLNEFMDFKCIIKLEEIEKLNPITKIYGTNNIMKNTI